MSAKVSIKDASRRFLEVMAESLAKEIDNGRRDLSDLLEQVIAQIPYAAEYDIDHRGRR